MELSVECELDADRLKPGLSAPLQRAMDLAQENGASTWLTTLPIQEYGFNLHKGALPGRRGPTLQLATRTCPQ